MRFPSNISKNVKEVYHLEPQRVDTETSARISADFHWDANQPKSLKEQCLEAIATTWKEKPIVNEIALVSDICTLLDLLPTDLPIALTVEKIAYDVYWLRCYKDRWPKAPPLGRNFSEVESLWPNKKEVGTDEVSVSSSKRSSVVLSKSSSQKSLSSRSEHVSERSYGRIMREDRVHRKTWKQHYLEVHLSETLENLEPVNYNPEEIKQLSLLCQNYVTELNLKQLRAPTTSDIPDHIPLNSILSGLPLLSELCICYKQTYVGEKFSWHIFNMTMTDVVVLAKGLEHTKLKALRIQNSDVNCVKVKMLLKSLLRNERLRTLDFSHCKISEHGTMALCKFVLEHCKLETLILSNNYIGPSSARCLAYILNENCSLTYLDLRLNMINSLGGKYLHAVLANGTRKLRTLVTAACGLTEENVEIESMLRLNTSLENLDMSNNRVGQEVGEVILQGLKCNRTLLSLDVRRCCINPDTEYTIREKVRKNANLMNRQRKTSRTSLLETGLDDMTGEAMFPESLISEINDIVFE